MQTKDINADIIVSGAGPAGLSLSLLLARAGLNVVLVDAEKPMDLNAPVKPSGRTLALLEGSINVLKAAGIWDALEPAVTPLRNMRIVDDSIKSADRIGVTFHARDIDLEQFGFNIPNAVLRKTLYADVLKTDGITHLPSTRLAGYDIDGGQVRAKTEDGRTITASLIVGTDGRNSIVRKVAGIDARIHDYGQMAMTCLIEHSKPHDFTSTEFHRSGGPFTFVPMAGNLSSVVWVEKTDDAKALLAMKRDDYRQAIQDRSCGLLGTITMASDPESWPLMFLSANTLTGERAALAAEAAHVLSPIGAQGLNLSLRDVASLAETIVDAARLGEDIGSATVLARYEARRRADLLTRTNGIDSLNRVVANDMMFVKDMRRFGLKALNKVPPLKSFITHQGLAPAWDEGRLLSGQSL